MIGDPNEIADQVTRELDAICKKYNCQLGIWLTWRDILHNLDKMKSTPGFDEAYFGIQIRLPDGKNETKKGDKGPAKHRRRK